MAAQRFLAYVAGRFQQIAGTVTSAGAANAGQLVALDSTGFLNNTLLPSGIGADTLTYTASEAIPAGSLVNLWSNAGVQSVRLADGSAAGKEVNGFALSAISSGQTGTINFSGQIAGLSGLTPGAPMYLSAASPGNATSVAPSVAGNIAQQIGVASSTSSISFRVAPPVLLA